MVLKMMNRNRGFTLAELMVTMAVVAIVLTIGVPAFQATVRNNRAVANANDFLTSLNLARNEAIKRGAGRVVLCPGTPAGCAGTWTSGWIVFVDTNNNGQWDAGERILQAHEPLSGNDTLTGNAPVSTYISFAADGSTRFANSNAFQAGTLRFSLCNSNNQQNTIVINSVGRARVAPQTCI